MAAATKVLPAEVDNMLRQTYGYFKVSAKRVNAFCNVQSILNLPKHKLLKLFDIRWLCLGDTVEWFLQQYDGLIAFFTKEVNDSNGKNIEAKMILEKLKNPYYRIYLQFLHYILPIVNRYNQEFQSEDSKIHLLYSKMETLYLRILSFYIDDKFLYSGCSTYINPENEENFVLFLK